MDDYTEKLEHTPPLGKSDRELREEGAEATVPTAEDRVKPGSPVPVPAATYAAGGASTAHHGSPVIATYASGEAIHDEKDPNADPDAGVEDDPRADPERR